MFLLYDRLTICFQYRTPARMTSCQKKTWQGERIENNKRQSNMDIRNLLGRLSFLRIRLFHFRLFGKHRTGIFYDKGLSPSDGKQD